MQRESLNNVGLLKLDKNIYYFLYILISLYKLANFTSDNAPQLGHLVVIEEPTSPPKPKKVEKPKPAPKKVSYDDFAKRNPKVNKKPTTRIKTRSAPKIAKISASTTNISNISTIKSDVVGTSTAMQDVLSAYYSEIRRIAKSNWAIPPTAQMTDWVVVAFRVSKNGDVSGVKVQSSSGNAELEKSALSTMRSVSLPPPPDNKPHTLSIKFDLK